VLCVLALVSTVSYIVLSSSVAKASPVPPGWSVPTQADPKVGYLNSVSCAPDGFCVASDTSGNTVTYSTANSLFSTPAITDLNGGLTSISCLSSSFCMAVDASGNYLTFNGTSWSAPVSIDPGNSLVGISCGSTTLCVAVDEAGFGLVFNGTSWSSPKALSGNAFVGVSCQTNICVAVDAVGTAYIYSTSGWSNVSGGGLGISSISCYQPGTCYVVNGAGQAILFNNNTWASPSIVDQNGLLSSVSCINSSGTPYCVASDQYGNFVVYNGTSWGTSTSIGIGSTPTYVSCVSSSVCVVVGQNGNGAVLNNSSVVTTSDIEPTTNSLTWVSCESSSNCTLFDQAGRTISWNGSAFQAPAQTSYGSFVSASCIASVGCLEAYTNGYVALNGSAIDADPSGLVSALGCLPPPSVIGNYCLLIDQSGNVYQISFQTGTLSATKLASFPSVGFSAAGCSDSTPGCVLVSSGGYSVFCSASTAGFSGCSTPTLIDSNAGLDSVSCSSSICIAVDSSGEYLSSTNGTNWTTVTQLTASSSIALNAISCSSTSCMAIDQDGNAYLYQNGSFSPAGLADPGNTEPSSISCPTASFCMVVDRAGQAITWSAIAPGVFYGEAPVRIVDTRTGATDPPTYAGDHLGPGGTLSVNVVGANSDNVPSDASAIVLNVTAVHPTQAGYITVWPTGTIRPNVSSLNFSANENAVANFVEVPIGANGEISLYNATGTTDVLVDVEGWISPATSAAGYYIALSSPARIADTRPASGYQGEGSPVTPSTPLTIQVEGLGGVPATGVSAVVVNITATGGTTNGGYLTAYPTGSSTPSASTVNFNADQTVPNRAIVALSSTGQMTIAYGPSGSVNVIVDVSGYFTSSSSTATGYEFHPVSPARILDTRSGSIYQGAGTTLVSGQPYTFKVEGLANIPSSAVAVLANATVTNTTGNNGYITIYPAGLSTKPATSDLNWMAGETVANAVLVTLGTNGQLTAEPELSNCDLIMDVFGWYG